MSQRHLVFECASCHRPTLVKYAIGVPRTDALGAPTHEIATYVCDRSLCLFRAKLGLDANNHFTNAKGFS